MTNNRKLISFDLSVHYYRFPGVGESFHLEERKKGLRLVLDYQFERFNRNLTEEDINWLSEKLEELLAEENHRHYSNHCVFDGFRWNFEAKTDTETYECSGSNYYPSNMRLFFILLHEHFMLPWDQETNDTLRAIRHSKEELGEAVDVRIGDETFPLKHFFDPNEKPEPEDPALEKAKAIALEDDPAMDMYTEYELAYRFFSTAYTAAYGPRPLIVMKDTGEAFLWHELGPDLGEQLGPTRLFTGDILDLDDEDDCEDDKI